MAPVRTLQPLSMLRQHLLVEFSGLKNACPEGIYMSLTPADPTVWTGVMFMRRGPYAPAILRFQISFPPTYPTLPPLITFSTEIFHPLITPLTTFMYTTDIQNSGTVSATDDERLPPGGFSFRHGFPDWFGRASRNALENSRQTSGPVLRTPIRSPGSGASGRDTPNSGASSSPIKAHNSGIGPQHISTYEVLEYIRSAFDNADVLDAIPLEAAGNPGAWHAWRAHRLKNGKLIPSPPPVKQEDFQWHDGLSEDESGSSASEGYQRLPGGTTLFATRKPGQWNWEGVWEVRVKRGVEGSLADSVLYGNTASNDDLDLIKFLSVDDDHLETMKENMIRSLETV